MAKSKPSLFNEIVYTPEELAAQLGVTEKTLLRWHYERKGPVRCQIGRFIRYRRQAVNDWLVANENRPAKRPSRR